MTAVIVTTAPDEAISAPVVSDTRRPYRAASRAKGIAANAAPRVATLAAIPDQASEPESLPARIAPIDKVAPMPRPAMICPRTSTFRTLRWRAGTSMSLASAVITVSCRVREGPQTLDRDINRLSIHEPAKTGGCPGADHVSGQQCPDIGAKFDDLWNGINQILGAAFATQFAIHKCFNLGVKRVELCVNEMIK